MKCSYLIAFTILLFFNMYFTSAFGVATIYSENYPLRMKPGEIKETFFLLMNTAEGDSDVSIQSELVKGGEIAELIDGKKAYDLPSGKEIEVPVKIEIPKDMPIGTKFKVAAMFRPKPSGIAGGGNIQFIVNIGKSFPVQIVGDDEKDNKKETFGLTLEGEPEEILEKSAPVSGEKKTVWLVIISFLLFSIVIMMVVIALLLRRRNSVNVENVYPVMNQQGYIQQTQQQNNQGNYSGFGYGQ